MGKNKGPKVAQAVKPSADTQVKKTSSPSNDIIAKHAQASKAKTQERIKGVDANAAKGAASNGKKSKRVPVKEPTPVSSSDEEDSADEGDSSDSAEQSASDSESESDVSEADIKPARTKTNVKASVKVNGSAAKGSGSSKSSESSESSESEDEAVATKSAPAEAVVAVQKESAGAAESSEESEDDESIAEAKANGTADPKTAVSGGLKTSESESDENSDESADDSESSDESSEEESAPKKRKAEIEPASVAKKIKTEVSPATNGDAGGQTHLFVGQLSWNIDEEWLRRDFEHFGEVTAARVVTDRDSGKSRGFGYVEFAKAEDAAKALAEMNGTQLDGRTINVDFAGRKDNSPQNPRGRADSRAKSFKDEASPPSDVLFVGNISFEATEDIVSEAFGKFAAVQSVRLPTDPESGDLKGFGYVQFGSIDDATAAYEGMKGSDICGRTIRLDYGKPRVDNGGGRGGRGGGRGFGGGFGGGRGRGGDRGGRGGGRGRGGFGDRGGRGGGRGRGGDSRNRGGFGDFQGKKTSF